MGHLPAGWRGGQQSLPLLGPAGRPPQEVLVGPVPAALAVREGTDLPPDAPSVLHRVLPGEPTPREDRSGRPSGPAAAATPRSATRPGSAAPGVSSRTCRLQSCH